MSIEVLGEGKFLRLVRNGGWEHVERKGCDGVVAIVALTGDREIVLVEQERASLGRRVLELPAGLVDPGESPEEAAARELMEETGFAAPRFQRLHGMPPSAGLTNERVLFFRAAGAYRVAEGGGDENERIEVHVIPLDQAREWVEARAGSGVVIDLKLFAGLYLASERTA